MPCALGSMVVKGNKSSFKGVTLQSVALGSKSHVGQDLGGEAESRPCLQEHTDR